MDVKISRLDDWVNHWIHRDALLHFSSLWNDICWLPWKGVLIHISLKKLFLLWPYHRKSRYIMTQKLLLLMILYIHFEVISIFHEVRSVSIWSSNATAAIGVTAHRGVHYGLTVSLEIKLLFVYKRHGVLSADVFLVKLDTCNWLSRHRLERMAIVLLPLVLKQVLSQS